MVRQLNVNKAEQLKNELMAEFNLSNADLNKIDASFEELVDSIALKTQLGKENISRIVENKLEYIHSKTV